MGECSSEGDVYRGFGIDRPTVGIEYGSEVSVSQFQPCEEHGGEGNGEDEADDYQWHFPPDEF